MIETHMIMQIRHIHGFTEVSSRGGNKPNVKKILIPTNLVACFLCSYNLYSQGMSVSTIFFCRDYSIF